MDITVEFLERINDLSVKEVSIGFTTIHLFSVDEFSAGQIGYSTGPDGNSLIGEKEGDWRKDWQVIGYDETCGDPLFIDSSVDTFPVFTAVHGMGDWQQTLIADSFETFLSSLKIIQRVARERENPMLLKGNPISTDERENALKEIEKLNSRSNLEFWELLLRPY